MTLRRGYPAAFLAALLLHAALLAALGRGVPGRPGTQPPGPRSRRCRFPNPYPRPGGLSRCRPPRPQPADFAACLRWSGSSRSSLTP
jgi:hypothetical protein